ncbi:MAG TPA: hypothetical protein EYN00_02860 [Planctomycetes bacterium]|nr:hypothetical protein [Planctomycetota bacterium]
MGQGERGQSEGREALFIDLLRLMRPRHWIKNGFLLLPVPFAIAAGIEDPPQTVAITLATGWIAFSLLCSAVYALNDVVDAERDAAHPRKKERPVAAQRLKKRDAVLVAGGLLTVSFALQMQVGVDRIQLYSLVYLGLNLFYIFKGRELVVVDVACLSGGFLLRILIGCALVDAAPSPWLLVCGTSVALFLALGKRRGDLLEGVGSDHRKSLEKYTLRALDRGMVLSALVSIAAYLLYSFIASPFDPDRRWLSLPFVIYGLSAHLYRSLTGVERRSPVDALIGSKDLIVALLGWLLSVTYSLKLF